MGELVWEKQPSTVKMGLVMEGISQIQVTGMGVGLVLLKLPELEDIGEIKQSHLSWWNTTFKSVSKWSPKKFDVRRSVLLNVLGIPLHAWDELVFKLLGSIYGVFLHFDEETIARKRLDVARIKVNTDRLGIIDDKISLKVMGAEFCLWVVEEGAQRWFSVEGREESMVGSCEGPIRYGDGDAFSDEEPISPRSFDSDLRREEKGKAVVRSIEKTGVQKVGREEVGKKVQGFGTLNEDDSLNCKMVGGHVDSLGKRTDVRGLEVDMCIRLEGDFSKFLVVPADSRKVGPAVSHAPETLSILLGSEGHVMAEDDFSKASGAQSGLSNLNVNLKYDGQSFEEAHLTPEVGLQGADVLERGAGRIFQQPSEVEAEVPRLNKHIRFVSEDSE